MNKIRLEIVSTATHTNLTKLTKDGNQALTRYVMEYPRNEISHKQHFLLSSDLEMSIVKSGTISDGFNISIKDYGHDANFLKKNILIASSRQLIFENKSFAPTKAKRNSFVLIEEDDKCHWFTQALFLFYREKMTTLDQDKAEFAFVQILDHSFNYDRSSFETIEIGD